MQDIIGLEEQALCSTQPGPFGVIQIQGGPAIVSGFVGAGNMTSHACTHACKHERASPMLVATTTVAAEALGPPRKQ